MKRAVLAKVKEVRPDGSAVLEPLVDLSTWGKWGALARGCNHGGLSLGADCDLCGMVGVGGDPAAAPGVRP